VGILGGFPTLGGEAATLEAGVVQAVGSTIEAAEEVGEKFLTGYTSIIDGMMMHLENPDFEMAEEQREAITAYAEALQPQFQEFSEELQERLDDITP
jgi:hypothetical protein